MFSIHSTINITKIYTFYSFEFAKNYVFKGESHNFWEIAYVDKGILEVMADTKHLELHSGQMIFHKPNEFHALWANGEIAPNVVVFSFKCESADMDFFNNKIIQLNHRQRELFKNCIQEAQNTLENHQVKDNAPFGSGQMLKICLEQFFIETIRHHDIAIPKESPRTKERMEKDLARDLVTFLENNVHANICLQDVANHYHLSSSYLKTLFKTQMDTSIMRYYRNKRIDKAKEYIRQSNMTFTEIADHMHYTSIHAFSRQFKDLVGMTPTEYARSLMYF